MGIDRDEELWQRLLAGDSPAFGLIWDRHRDRVYGHLLRLGMPSAEVEDLTAAAFLELWRRRRSVRFVDGSLLPWLIVTAQNLARNANRARNRYRAFLAKLPPPLPTLDPADEVVDRHSHAAVQIRELMSATSPTDRALLALTALEQFTVREAAAAVGVSESAAKMRLSRLRSRLRTALLEQPVIEEV